MSADCLFPGPNRRRKLGLQSSGRKIELIGAHHDIKILSGRLPETVKIQQADFSKNLRASHPIKGLSNEPNFGRINLAGQYL
jgi:hypothetical protein